MQLRGSAVGVSVSDIRDLLPPDPDSPYPICYQTGDIALICSVSDVVSLYRKGLVVPVLRKGFLRSIRLCVSVQSVHRTLKALRVATATPAGSITKRRSGRSDMKWASCPDRAKGGFVGGFQRFNYGRFGTVAV